ncbi:hypothetical protein E8E11_002494 [Didymella keratinophila]|nr:hypothetical protein E8E11_002494 [Didymella keratinophila]
MVLPIENPTKSYWIEAAESPLRNFRSGDKLPKETDILIIGSGYAGAATAYWIHKYTANSQKQPAVTLLEARDICGSATGRNGGQLRPHAYSRYPLWSERFGSDGAMELITHEMAHLSAFKNLCAEEGITEEACLKFGETFDAAMTDEAWTRLKGALEAMRKDYGDENDIVKACRTIDDAQEAEEFTQMKGALAAVVHPTGQIWSQNYHLRLPPPYNMIILGGARPVTVHKPETCTMNDDEDQQIEGVTNYFKSWPASDVKDWPGSSRAEFGRPDDEGGCWTGGNTSPPLVNFKNKQSNIIPVQTSSADGFPFVGSVPDRDGHFIAAGFAGHGMPRILLSAARIAPLVLESLGIEFSPPSLVSAYPPLPKPFHATAERIEGLQNTDVTVIAEQYKKGCEESAKKPFCDAGRPVSKIRLQALKEPAYATVRELPRERETVVL